MEGEGAGSASEQRHWQGHSETLDFRGSSTPKWLLSFLSVP